MNGSSDCGCCDGLRAGREPMLSDPSCSTGVDGQEVGRQVGVVDQTAGRRRTRRR